MSARERLALALYVEWCLGSTIGTVEQATSRWRSMADCGRRTFYALADVAIAQCGRLCMACAHESAEDAELRL